MNLVFVASECAPWSKTGGLGDVMAALPKALARRGHRVMAVAPRYAEYAEGWETGVRITLNVFHTSVEVGFFHGFVDGVDVVFVDHPCYHGRSGGAIYGGDRTEVAFRCALLSKAAIEAARCVPCGGVPYGEDNLCFVANDWHAALVPVYLQDHYRAHGQFTYARAVLVIHNLAHQGRGPPGDADLYGVGGPLRAEFEMDDPVGGRHSNIMRAGIIAASRVVAVSHGYAWECQTMEGGWGLDGTLRDASWKFRGIVVSFLERREMERRQRSVGERSARTPVSQPQPSLTSRSLSLSFHFFTQNGIDYSEWSPQADACLDGDGYTRYDPATPGWRAGKAACKAALQAELGLPVNPDAPLLAFIGRLDHQKGVDLIMDSYDWLMGEGVQLVMLGSGRGDLEDGLRGMEAGRPDQCRAWVGFSVAMAHRMTAGADMLLMPSRFEPCGLNQLYAMVRMERGERERGERGGVRACVPVACFSVSFSLLAASALHPLFCFSLTFPSPLTPPSFFARPTAPSPSCTRWAACATRSPPSIPSTTRARGGRSTGPRGAPCATRSQTRCTLTGPSAPPLTPSASGARTRTCPGMWRRRRTRRCWWPPSISGEERDGGGREGRERGRGLREERRGWAREVR